MGKVEKGAGCSVSGCSDAAVRSVSAKKVKDAGLELAGKQRRAYLCRTHYKQYKKAMKEERLTERLGWD